MDFMNIFSHRGLNKTIENLGSSLAAQNEALIKSNAALEAELHRLIAEKQKSDELMVQFLDSSFKDAVTRLEAVNVGIGNAAQSIKESCANIPRLKPGINKIDAEAINGFAVELEKLRKTIMETIHSDNGAAADRLNSISTELEKSVNKTFSTIDNTLKENAEKLSASYERFFDLCKKLDVGETAGERE